MTGKVVFDANNITKIQNYINGGFLPSHKHIESVNPKTRKTLCLVPDSDVDVTELAVLSATHAATSWASTPVSKKSKILNAIADLIDQNADLLAEAESADQGKPIWLAKAVDIPRSAANFRHFAAYIESNFQGSSTTNREFGVVNYIHRKPATFGKNCCVLISPWNLPLYLLTWKIAPCLAFGCTCVCKPSEFTSLTAYFLSQLIDSLPQELKLPDGVINFMYGYGNVVGEFLINHKNATLISFTGSTAVGNHIRKITSLRHEPVKLSLEMGGENAAIIFADSCEKDDVLADTVNTCLRSSFINQGEVCLCTERIYVQSEAAYLRFIDAFKRQMVSEGWAFSDSGKPTSSKIGAIVSEQHYNKVVAFIEKVKNSNGKHGIIAAGGRYTDAPGWFIEPTLVVDCPLNSELWTEEVFGPLTCVTWNETVDEMVHAANEVTSYGLCATVFTRDVSQAHDVAQKLNVGTVWVNCWLVRDLRMPFGGVKGSGIGREGGKYSEEFFTEETTICLKI